MTPEQRAGAVTYLSEGATFEEVAAMIGASRRAFELAWIEGKRDAEDGLDSESAKWYREAAAARARIRATLRAEAREAAGSREATDRLAVLSALLAEEEPQGIADDSDSRRIRFENYSQATQELLHRAFVAMVNEDTERRGGVGPFEGVAARGLM